MASSSVPAASATDAEVAADLFLRRETVEYHLSSVSRKTGMGGRSDLGR